jgi:hypothetical protein
VRAASPLLAGGWPRGHPPAAARSSSWSAASQSGRLPGCGHDPTSRQPPHPAGDAAQETGLPRVLLISVAVLTVMLSWTVVNTVYTLRYAHLHYASAAPAIAFGNPAGPQQPGYHDFAYVAFTIGMTYQVSDTTLRIPALKPSRPMAPASLVPSWQTITLGDLLQREVTGGGRPVSLSARGFPRWRPRTCALCAARPGW